MYGLKADVDLSFLKEREIIQVCIGAGQFAIHFDYSVSVYIENYISIKLGNDWFQFSPKSLVGSKFLVDFLGKKIKDFCVCDDGELKIEFYDGYELFLYEDPHYESYIISFNGNEIVV